MCDRRAEDERTFVFSGKTTVTAVDHMFQFLHLHPLARDASPTSPNCGICDTAVNFSHELHCFSSIDSPSFPIQATYTSHLTINSSKYHQSVNDIEPNHNYELIEVNVAENGSYILGSDSEMNTYGYLYQNKFDPFATPFEYLINQDDDGGCNYQFQLTDYLYEHRKYILMITTSVPNETGSFSIFVLGPNNVTLKHSGEYTFSGH